MRKAIQPGRKITEINMARRAAAKPEVKAPEPPSVVESTTWGADEPVQTRADANEVRNLLMDRIPHGEKLVLNVAGHDGLIDVTIQCGALRWAHQMGVGMLSAQAIADSVEATFREWIALTLGNIFEPVNPETGTRAFSKLTTDHFRRSARGFQAWFREDPRSLQWLGDEAA